ncbi:glutathione S-transferase [Granulosicoccaceae sp. 1_MG-2023]|nr:glutathione S-transferase [Granulosicoccaceae sp. 1_MG-2023]
MITLHHLESSRSQRILWLLEELGLEYRIERYARDAETLLAPERLRAVHPLGYAPVLQDGDLVLAESAVIIEYLLHEYGDAGWQPQRGDGQWLDYAYWLHYGEGSVMPMLVMKLVCQRVRGATPWLLRPLAGGISKGVMGSFVQPSLDRHLAFMEASLKGRDWFVGQRLTGADVQMSYVVAIAAGHDALEGRYPRLSSWLDRVVSRPAWQRALAAGGALSPA